jgi:putative flavoprotein involved in K+ transport
MNDMQSPARNNPRSETLLEEGEAFVQLSRSTSKAAPCERFDVVVIGGGQAGLSVGHHLGKRGLRFIIIDANARVGDTWRKRWDSLRLFTPARYDGLDGLPFPARPDYFPTKDEMADYLESYVQHFRLPVRSSTRVDRVFKRDGRFVISAGGTEIEADQVVVAMANYQCRRVPALAAELSPEIVQVHSIDYRNPEQLRDGDTLIVGAGNSGSEIAMELSRTRRVWMAGRDTGQVPFKIGGFWARHGLARFVLRVLFHRIFTVRTPIGRKVRPRVLHIGGPLIRVKRRDLRSAGVVRAPRVAAVKDGLPLLEDGQLLDVKNVVWCTGYEPGFTWLDLPIFDEHGQPRHEAGVVTTEPGLYFVGLHFLYSFSSTMIHGVGRDAARIAGWVCRRVAPRAMAAGQAQPPAAALSAAR